MPLQERIDRLVEQQRLPVAEGVLLLSEVVRYVPHATPNPGTNDTYYVAFDDGQEAFHKPFGGVSEHLARSFDQYPDSVPLNECAAWRLAAQLGGSVAEVVAPCVLRSIDGTAGSLSARRFGQPATHELFITAPDQCRAAAFFDSLIGQQDRHMGNYRWDPHDARLGLIDHGYAFAAPGWRFNTSVFVWARCEEGGEALSEWEEAALRQLLASDALHGLGGILTDDQSQALYRRAERMLAEGAILRPGDW